MTSASTSALAVHETAQHRAVAPDDPPCVELIGVHKAYRDISAVRGVDLTIDHGQCVAVLGPNGAGKSTMLDLIVGLQVADRGTTRGCGLPPSAAVARGEVGAMLQLGVPIELLLVRELVAMVASLYPMPREVDDVLRVADLERIATRRTSDLSGGQGQRLRFACALVTGARLLVLDEPTAALDVDARASFWAAVRAVAESGTTVIFATHHLEEADTQADRVVMMAAGRIVADGPPAELRAQIRARTISALLDRPDPSVLAELPGVSTADVDGHAITLRCDDADRALRELLGAYSDAREIEVRSAGLDEVFARLTRAGEPTGLTGEASR